jgi:hypothetical protein
MNYSVHYLDRNPPTVLRVPPTTGSVITCRDLE